MSDEPGSQEPGPIDRALRVFGDVRAGENAAKQVIWMPTSREEKYKAKQAIDTFLVRAGDMAAAGLVFLGTHVSSEGAGGAAA